MFLNFCQINQKNNPKGGGFLSVNTITHEIFFLYFILCSNLKLLKMSFQRIMYIMLIFFIYPDQIH